MEESRCITTAAKVNDQMVALSRSRTVALAALFGSVVFISKVLLPSPFDKTLVVVQAIFLGLGAIMLPPLGATLVALSGGLLTAAWRAPMAVYTVSFAVIYGLLVDFLCRLLKVQSGEGEISRSRLVAAVTASTVLVGMASYYTTVFAFQLLPRNLTLELAILVAGTLSGLAGGYLAAVLWQKSIRHIVRSPSNRSRAAAQR